MKFWALGLAFERKGLSSNSGLSARHLNEKGLTFKFWALGPAFERKGLRSNFGLSARHLSERGLTSNSGLLAQHLRELKFQALGPALE